MRRKDREVTGRADLEQILKSCEVCRLGLVDGDQPYIVPLNYAYEWQGENPIIYAHCATVGYKLDLLAKNNKVCLEIDTDHQLVVAEAAADYSYAYSSFIGFGRAAVLTDDTEKRFGLQLLMQHIAGPGEYPLPENLDNVAVLRIELDKFSGKRRPNSC